MAHHIQLGDEDCKPDAPPLTRQWQATTCAMTLEERGFAIAGGAVMYNRRRKNLAAVLADAGRLAEDLNSRTDTVIRLRECFAHIPGDVVEGQRRRISDWPAWMVQEIAP